MTVVNKDAGFWSWLWYCNNCKVICIHGPGIAFTIKIEWENCIQVTNWSSFNNEQVKESFDNTELNNPLNICVIVLKSIIQRYICKVNSYENEILQISTPSTITAQDSYFGSDKLSLWQISQQDLRGLIFAYHKFDDKGFQTGLACQEKLGLNPNQSSQYLLLITPF